MGRSSIRLLVLFLAFLLVVAGGWTWMFSYPLPNVPPPRLAGSDDIAIRDGSSTSLDGLLFWNDEVLKKFNEQPLRNSAASIEESYRLLFLPTFDKPILIQISKSGNRKRLSVKMLNGPGGFGLEKLGKISQIEDTALTDEEWNHAVELLDNASYWSLPSIDKTDEPVGDGALWTIEGIKDGDHHDVSRITPKPAFLETCKYLLDLSGHKDAYQGYVQ